MSRADGNDKTPFASVNGFATGPATVVQYERNGAWVVVAHGAFDMDSISRLAEALETATQKHPRVVDTSGVSLPHDGPVQNARMFKIAKDSADKARTQAIHRLKAVLVVADPGSAGAAVRPG